MREHLNKIDNEDDATVYQHFHTNSKCTKEDIVFRVLDFVYENPKNARSKSLRKLIENNWIQRLDTYAPKGLNIMDSRFG